MTLMYANNATSRLRYDVLAGATSVQIYSGEGARFPQPIAVDDFFMVTLDDRRTGQIEICKCTARSGDNLTIVRAQEGTTAQDFLLGAICANRFTAGTIDYILSGTGYSEPEADAKFVDIAGDTMTGPLVLSGNPTLPLHPATKQWVEARDAPSDGTTYGRQSGGWTSVVTTATYTPADVLTKIKTVDGTGSGLDADLLDGHDSTYFATDLDLDNLAGAVDSIVSFPEAPNDGKPYARQSLAWNDLTDEFAAKANLISPTFTGDPKAPTPSAGDNDTSIATTAYVTDAVATGMAGVDMSLKVSKSGDTMSGQLVMKASDTTSAPVNLPQGVGPTSPANGDIWMNGTTLTIRGSGTSYAVAYLNGSSTFTGTKTFSAKPIMTTPAAGTASINLPHGTAPSAPVNGDMWSTAAGLYVQVSTATVGPLIAEAPNDGTQYVRKNQAWTAVSVPPGTVMSDTAPGSPVSGQLWFETDTGNLFVWYVDANSSQWVQVGGGAEGVQPDFIASPSEDMWAGFKTTEKFAIVDNVSGIGSERFTFDSGGVSAPYGASFNGSTAYVILAPTGTAGEIFLRPKGRGSSAGQWKIDNGGILSTDTNVTYPLQLYNGANNLLLSPGTISAPTLSFQLSGVTKLSMSVNSQWTFQVAASGYTIISTGNSGGAALLGYNAGGSYGMVGYNNGSGSSYSFYGNTGALLSAGAWGTSDARAKENVVDLDPAAALANVKALRAVSYYHKISELQERGWIAQEVEPVVPEAVSIHLIPSDDEFTRNALGLPKEGEAEMYCMQDKAMIATLWAAVQALTAKVEALEAAGGV